MSGPAAVPWLSVYSGVVCIMDVERGQTVDILETGHGRLLAAMAFFRIC